MTCRVDTWYKADKATTGTDKKLVCVCVCVIITYVWMSVSQQLVEDMAELPAEHCVAGKREPVDCCPEGVGAFLMMGSQYAG